MKILENFFNRATAQPRNHAIGREGQTLSGGSHCRWREFLVCPCPIGNSAGQARVENQFPRARFRGSRVSFHFPHARSRFPRVGFRCSRVGFHFAPVGFHFPRELFRFPSVEFR